MKTPDMAGWGESLPDINRCALVITAGRGYFEWIEGLPDNKPGLTIERLQEESTVYLIPEVDFKPDKWLSKNFKKIFENELMAWWMDKNEWPKNRSFKNFKHFFNIQFASVTLDMGKGQIKRYEG
jgi:hypothetical protein